MRKPIAIFLTSLTLFLTACGTEETTNTQKIPRENPAKEVQTFIAGTIPAELFIEKTGNSSAESFISISPELNGKIQNLKVKVGDQVKAGQILATLGDSQTTAQIDLQYKTAQESEKLARISEELTKYAASQNVDGAQLGVIAAQKAHENALKNRQNTLNSFELQYQNAEIESQNANLGADNASDSLDSLKDLLYDTEDDLDDLRDEIDDTTDNTTLAQLLQAEKQLEAQIDTLENQIDNAEIAVDLAENRYKQSQIALEQLIAATQSQLTQIDSGIDNAIIQYQSAINQLESAQAGAQLQKIGAETQSLQSSSNLQNTMISLDKKNLKSPISGKITEITIKPGQTVNPGQAVIKVENDDSLIIKTTVNAEESDLITKNSPITIIYNNRNFSGKILTISPSLNSITNKIDLEIETSKDLKLPTGAFVKVQIGIHPQENFFVPLNSIFLNEGQKTIRIIDNKNRVQYQPVEIGEIIGTYIEITSGLKGGEKIITTVDTFINQGEKVKTTNDRK